MPEQESAVNNDWNVLLVEDDPETCRQIKEFFSDEMFDSRKLAFQELSWEPAFKLIRERKADLVILDIYRGEASAGGERVGEQVLSRIIESGFVSVVIHTNLPEGLQRHTNQFVRLVAKTDGLTRLRDEIQSLLITRIPRIHRAVVNRLDSILRDYMWKFVEPNWERFKPLVNKPEFLRLVVQRLAITLAREGIDQMTAEVFGDGAVLPVTDPENVHPAEYYVKPPLGTDPLLGDIRVRTTAGGPEYFVVLWPSCDMVSTRGRIPKTERVLCAKASLLKDTPEMVEWLSTQSASKKRAVAKIMKNDRDKSPERYHYLPGVWDIPDLVVDFQMLEPLNLSDVRTLSCLASIASPFAEALGARFGRYWGRLGTPDLEIESIIVALSPSAGTNA